MVQVTIDKKSGYCFGVEYAILMAEEELRETGKLYCLGDIVHNRMEVERLTAMGLQIIDHDHLEKLSDAKVLIRAHGEPPETYRMAMANNIELVDASCPVVLKLQNRVKYAYDEVTAKGGQLVIYGKHGHAEVIGLTGQTTNRALVVSSIEELDIVDFSKPVTLYSQTTKSTSGFQDLKEEMKKRVEASGGDLEEFHPNDTICRQVSNREPQLKIFSQEKDVIVFVAGKKSSNGKSLFKVCLQHNPRSYFVESVDEINPSWFSTDDQVGISGATSTPMWLMRKVADTIFEMGKNQAS